jgi:cytochrome c nitrite reductase small subunit
VDCHLPHYNPVHYYFEKARTGFHDVYVFGSGLTPALIRAGPDSEGIIQDNCIRCHAPAVEEIMAGVQPMDRNCWDCHRNVAHGPRGLSFVPYQDSILYPVK